MSRMIDWTKFPKRFTLEAMDRFVFVPESSTHASEEQVRALLADAESYVGKSGEHDRTPGLGISARAVVRVCRQALGQENDGASPTPASGDPDVEFRRDLPQRKRRRPAWAYGPYGGDTNAGRDPS